MEITSLHKYISLNKLANGSTEVLFSGQPCLYTSSVTYNILGEGNSSYQWKINPIFAKLVYGANVFEDIPQCSDTFDTDEEAIAAGLVKLHEMGAFSTEVDLPEDSYAATLNDIQDELKTTAIQNSNGIMDAQKQYNESLKSIFGSTILEAICNLPKKKKFTVHYTKDGSKKRKVEEAYSLDSVLEKYESVDDITLNGKSVMLEANEYKRINSYYMFGNTQATRDKAHEMIKNLHGETTKENDKHNRTLYKDKNGQTVALSEIDGEGDTTWNIHKFKHNIKESVEPYDKWVSDVQAKHGSKKIKFKGRIEQGVHTTSAEVPGEDRSYGVWDHDKEEGHIFEEATEIQEKRLTQDEKDKMEEIVTALKKDKKFVSKYGVDSAYAIATAKAKDVA